MSKLTIKALVDGGKATPAPPLGPALGAAKLNIGQVVAKINEKTKALAGMKVPVDVIYDTVTKDVEIKVGTPPASQLLKKEAGIAKGAGDRKALAGNVSIASIIKVAKMKLEGMNSRDIKSCVSQIIGSCVSLGLTVDGKTPKDAQAELAKGAYDALLK